MPFCPFFGEGRFGFVSAPSRSRPFQPFGWEGSPTRVDYRKTNRVPTEKLSKVGTNLFLSLKFGGRLWARLSVFGSSVFFWFNPLGSSSLGFVSVEGTGERPSNSFQTNPEMGTKRRHPPYTESYDQQKRLPFWLDVMSLRSSATLFKGNGHQLVANI